MTGLATTPASGGPTRVGRLLLAMALLLALVFGGIAWLQAQSLRLLSAKVVYQGDNIVWSFFQLETEYLRLDRQMHDFVREVPALPAPERRGREEALRERYDIFVSRISLVDPVRTREVMPDLPEHRRVLGQLNAVVARVDPVLGPDAPSPVDVAALRAVLADVDALAPAVRDLSLLSNQAVGAGIVSRNEGVRQQNRIGIGLTIFQCLLILVFAIIVVRQVRALEQRRVELEQLASRLQEARLEAEQASRAKSAFLANMSHELRTPFNGLLGMMSLLDRSALDAQQREHLQIARQSGEHLLHILNDVLDLSKLESGRLELSPHPLDLNQLVEDVRALMQPQARSRSLLFEVTLAPDLPTWVEADAKRLKQVLFNLIGNAIKFTDRGGVRLLIDPVPAKDGAAGAALTRIRVIDTGIGMNEQTLQRLFQRFSQGDDSIGRRFGGTGLGLEISRELVRMMGGDIQVVSQPGQGSEFSVLLPLRALDAAEIAAQQAAAAPPVPLPPPGAVPAGGQLRVLVADDHPVNRKYMQVLLERLGHRVSLAGDGAEALQRLQAARFDLVLMDVHMPTMDGLEATRQIRGMPEPDARVPVIALTADAFAESRERARQAGMDDFLAKPVQLHDIENMLRRHFGARALVSLPPAPAPEPPAAAAAPEPARGVRPGRGEAARHLDLDLMSDSCALLGVGSLRSLLGSFFEDGSRTLADLVDRLESGEGHTQDLKSAAHRLKGSAGTLGLRQVADLARSLESGEREADAQAARQLQQLMAAARQACARLGWVAGDAG